MVEYITGLSQNLNPINDNLETSSNEKASAVLSDNFDTFLKILTAQLKNQDPLDPLDTSEFTNQLIQFSNVEQAILTNQHLEKISTSLDRENIAEFVSYLGKKAIVETNSIIKTGSNTAWTINSQKAAEADLNIIDAQGKIVYKEKINLQQGHQEFEWDGRNNNGVDLPDGPYQVVINAVDEQDQPIRVTVATTGRVTAIDLTGLEPYAIIGDRRILIKAISRLEI